MKRNAGGGGGSSAAPHRTWHMVQWHESSLPWAQTPGSRGGRLLAFVRGTPPPESKWAEGPQGGGGGGGIGLGVQGGAMEGGERSGGSVGALVELGNTTRPTAL